MRELSPKGKALTDLLLEVFRVNGLLLEAGDRLTRPVGLSSARWQILGVVDHGAVSVAHIARTMGLTRQSVQQTADALERDGFVEYVDNPHHRRAKLVSMTPKGRKALAYVEERHAEWADRIGGEQGLKSLRAAVEALRQVRESLEKDAPQATDTTD